MSNRDEKEKIEEISTSYTKEQKEKWKAETSREQTPSASNQLASGSGQQLSALTPEQKLTLTQVEKTIDLFFHRDKHPKYGSLKEQLSKLEGCELIDKTYKLKTVVPCAFCKQDSVMDEAGFFRIYYKSCFLKKEDLEVPICKKCRLLGEETVYKYFYGGEDRGMVLEPVSEFSFDLFRKKLLERKDNEIFGTALQQERQLKKSVWKVYDFAHVFQEIGVKNESLVEKNNQLRKEVEESQSKEKSLADDLFETKRKGEDLLIDSNNRILYLTSEVARLKNLLSEQHSEFQKTVSGSDSGKLASSIAKDQAIKTLTLELEDCKNQLEQALQRNIYIDGYKRDIEYLRDKVKRLEKERDDWKFESDDKEKEILDNTKFFQQAKEEIAELEEEIKELQKKIEEWKKKYEDESSLRLANIDESNNALAAAEKKVKELESKIRSEWWKAQVNNTSGRLAGLTAALIKYAPLPQEWHQRIETAAIWETGRGLFNNPFTLFLVIWIFFYEGIRWLFWKVIDNVRGKKKEEETEKKPVVVSSSNNDIQWEIVRRILDRDPQKRISEKKNTKK